jgi:DNA-binding CsgD family transcriptional regulator
MISPYLGHALDHHELFLKSKTRDLFHEIIDENWSRGIILLDESMQFIHMNRMAKDFCQDLMGDPPHPAESVRIPPMLLKDSYAMSEQLSAFPDESLLLPRHRVLRIHPSQEYGITSRLLSKGITSGNERYFLISIQKIDEMQGINQNNLREMYKLTERELDIVRHLFQGLRNAEIAQRLYLSEITVKKHVQSIFQKIGVKNRTAVVRKILEDHKEVVWLNN